MQVQSVSAPSSAPAPVLSLFVSAEAGDDSDPQCGLKRSAPCQSISRALSKFPQEVWLLGGTYNASEVSVQSATPQQLLRVQDPLSNFIAINGLMDAALACRANQAAPDPTAANSGEFLFVDQGSELFLSNVSLRDCLDAAGTLRFHNQGLIQMDHISFLGPQVLNGTGTSTEHYFEVSDTVFVLVLVLVLALVAGSVLLGVVVGRRAFAKHAEIEKQLRRRHEQSFMNNLLDGSPFTPLVMDRGATPRGESIGSDSSGFLDGYTMDTPGSEASFAPSSHATPRMPKTPRSSRAQETSGSPLLDLAQLDAETPPRTGYGAAGDRGTVSTKTTYPYEVSSSSIRDLNSTGAYSPSFSSPQDPLERTRARFRNDNRGEQTPSRGPAWKGEHHPPAGAIAVASSPQFDPRSGAAGCNGSNHANNSQLISSTLHGPKRVVHQREQKHTPMHHTTRGTGEAGRSAQATKVDKKSKVASREAHPHNRDHSRSYLERIMHVKQELLLKSSFIDMDEVSLHEQLGHGAFGVVYRGTWRKSQCAVKMIQRQPFIQILDEDVRVNRREAILMCSLKHPNILLTLGIGFQSIDDTPNPMPGSGPSGGDSTSGKKLLCIVTELLERGSLFDVLKEQRNKFLPELQSPQVKKSMSLLQKPGSQNNAEGSNASDSLKRLDFLQILNFAIDAARGMLFMHSNSPPIVHRDLKSSNLLVDQNWVVKVCDFGNSRLVVHKRVADTGGDAAAASQGSGSPGSGQFLSPMTRLGSPPSTAIARTPTAANAKRPSGTPSGNSGPNPSPRHRGGIFTPKPKTPLPNTPGSMAKQREISMTNTIGTAAWTAPELFQMKGYAKFKTVDRALSIDVYSFGIVMWEMATFRIPFDAETRRSRFAVSDAVCRGVRPPLPSEFRSSTTSAPAATLPRFAVHGISRDYVRILKDCWHQSPRRRPSFAKVYERLVALRDKVLERVARDEAKETALQRHNDALDSASRQSILEPSSPSRRALIRNSSAPALSSMLVPPLSEGTQQQQLSPRQTVAERIGPSLIDGSSDIAEEMTTSSMDFSDHSAHALSAMPTIKVNSDSGDSGGPEFVFDQDSGTDDDTINADGVDVIMYASPSSAARNSRNMTAGGGNSSTGTTLERPAVPLPPTPKRGME